MDYAITKEYVIATTGESKDESNVGRHIYGKDEIFSIDHFFESKGRTFSRKVYGIMDFMAAMGGFWGFLLPNLAFIVDFYQKNAFEVDKTTRSFRVKPTKFSDRQN